MATILILGGSGMLGHTMFTELTALGHDVHATVRSTDTVKRLGMPEAKIHAGVEASDMAAIEKLLDELKPNMAVNCLGITKQKLGKAEIISALEINAIFPQRLAMACQERSIRMLQISTDCVFDGITGMYTEGSEDFAHDLYGESKRFGEVDGDGILTIRTSIIGHELTAYKSLVDWFMGQEGSTRGFSKAIFSGFPTITLTRLLHSHILPNSDLQGLYHVSVDPIDKLTLLQLIAKVYDKTITIEEDQSVVIDRSLDSSRFRKTVGYTPPNWEALIREMHEHYLASPWYDHERSDITR